MVALFRIFVGIDAIINQGFERNSFTGMKGLKLLLVIVLACGLVLGAAGKAIAQQCRTVGEQEICLVSVKRSAKYYWQYRAVLKIDGKRQPTEKFDCHPRNAKVQVLNPSLHDQKRAFVCNIIPQR